MTARTYRTNVVLGRPSLTGFAHMRFSYEKIKGGTKRPAGPLGDPETVKELRGNILPRFMEGGEIEDLTEKGFRVAVDIRPPYPSPEVHLISGNDVSAQNPQDWLSPQTKWNPEGPAVFFEKCAWSATRGLEIAPEPFGNRMLYAGKEREVFGVMDGDPKSETHFLVLAVPVFGNIVDAGFTAEHMIKFFETAYQICEEMGILDQHIRFVLNTGTGFQVGARVHMHVQSAKEGLPIMFPEDYGFEVAECGVIRAPADSEVHGLVTTLIRARQQIQGFSSHAVEVKKGIDQILFGQLEKIKYSGKLPHRFS